MDRPWDIIDEIAGNVGKIRSQKYSRPGEEGYYSEAYRDAIRSDGKILFSRSGQSPDSAADALRRSRILPEDATVEDMWDAIYRAAQARKSARASDAPERQLERFSKTIQAAGKKRCKKLVPARDLQIGQSFRLGGETFHVQDIDPDTEEVVAVDGKRFGRQTIPDGALIPTDAECPKQPKAKTKPKAKVSSIAAPAPPAKPRPRSRPARLLRRPIRPPGDLRYLIRRRKPARKSPVQFVAIRLGSKVRVSRVSSSSLTPVGTFGAAGLKAWAQKNGVRIK